MKDNIPATITYQPYVLTPCTHQQKLHILVLNLTTTGSYQHDQMLPKVKKSSHSVYYHVHQHRNLSLHILCSPHIHLETYINTFPSLSGEHYPPVTNQPSTLIKFSTTTTSYQWYIGVTLQI